MKRHSFWEVWLELTGNAFLIALGFMWLAIFVYMEVRSIWEPDVFIRRAEIVFNVLLVVLGAERMVKDLRRFRNKS